VVAGCDLTETEETRPQSPDFEVTDDLESRITDLSGNASPQTATQTADSADFSVSGVIRVTPPTVVKEGDSMTTAASHMSFNGDGGDRVFVGYKIRGEEFGGGIDVFDAAQPDNLTGINSLKSENLDVQEIADDPDEEAEYVAGAVKTNTASASPSVITKLSLSGSDITVSDERLSANVAKSVVNAPSGDDRHDFYVVTDGNSLYRYDASLGDELVQTADPSTEFSSITAHQDLLIMLTKSGELWTSDFSSPSDPAQSGLSLDGSGIDPRGIARINASSHESSSDNFVYAALNAGGFRVLDDDVDTEMFSRTDGYYTSVSATDESDYLYASRADGTVEVYEFDGNNSPSWSDEPIATINTADFQDGSDGSQPNQVLAVGDYLYVANSDGGLLVLEVDDGS
jgi:hypothetical protein